MVGKGICQNIHKSYAPVLHAVPIESFGKHVIVVEDDPTVSEAIDLKN